MKQRRFEVIIEETISQSFFVEATSEEEAERKAVEKYDNGEFVLEPGYLTAKQMQLHDLEKNTYTEWMDF